MLENSINGFRGTILQFGVTDFLQFYYSATVKACVKDKSPIIRFFQFLWFYYSLSVVCYCPILPNLSIFINLYGLKFQGQLKQGKELNVSKTQELSRNFRISANLCYITVFFCFLKHTKQINFQSYFCLCFNLTGDLQIAYSFLVIKRKDFLHAGKSWSFSRGDHGRELFLQLLRRLTASLNTIFW